MPAPQKQMMATLAQNFFRTNMVKLPVDWKPPGDQYNNAFKSSELVTPPDPSSIFLPSTLNKYHTDTHKDIGKQYADFIDGICGAICDAIDKWMKLTMVAGMIVTGPVGVCPPGTTIGPPLMPFILATAPNKTPMLLRYSMAVALAFNTQWLMWQTGLMGQLMYPPFAAFPGPMAPPTPNVPMPLIAFASPGEVGLSPAMLKTTMIANLGDPLALHHMELFDAIAQAFGVVFPIFKASTLFTKVMGMGPIPSFVPPFVPVGPVVGGTSLPIPGVLT